MESKVDYYKKNPWHVIITEDNKKVLSGWRFTKPSYDFYNCIGGPVGMALLSSGKLNPEHNIKGIIKTESYDFGQEISFKEFQQYVLEINVDDSESCNIDSLVKLLKNIN